MKVLALCIVLFGTCQGFLFPKIKTVDQLDVAKYTGRWYEMYNSLFQRITFEKNSYCTNAIYTPRKGSNIIGVLNSGVTGGPKGKVSDINGTVYQTDPSNAPGELLVSFPSAPQSKNANYLVIKLGPPTHGEKGQYEYTVITSPGKNFSWILARDVDVFRQKYEAETLQFLKDNGFVWPWNKPMKTYQEKDCFYESYPEEITPRQVIV
ncbi:uncharacterized protein [Clytia hemisphaerica]|uniref:Lipocalin/cytosolic fatty-acid binding domain-containing protein n=1 Tax=Clytia hemisphaerica TaxID=252671 RepID=A0A7M5XER5_9CNID|eukprot:TCONS_00013578-protein